MFNAVTLTLNDVGSSRGSSTLFLYDMPAITKYLDGLNKSGIFEDIVVLNNYIERGNYLLKIIGMIFPYLSFLTRIKNRTSRQCIKDFENIYISSVNLLVYQFIRFNKQARVNLFEDGGFSYVGYDDRNFFKKKVKRFLRLFRIEEIKVDKKYLYKPEFAVNTYNYNLIKMPSLNVAIDKLRSIFSYDKEKINGLYRNRRIIYLDQTYADDLYNNDFLNLFVNRIKKYSDILLIRPHPTMEQRELNNFLIDEVGLHWELVSYDYVYDNTILMSIGSSAVFTPNLLYNKRYTIVLLHRLALYHDTEYFKNTDSFLIHMSEVMKDVKFIIPNNWDEFEVMLNGMMHG